VEQPVSFTPGRVELANPSPLSPAALPIGLFYHDWALLGATQRFLEAQHQHINYIGVLRLKKKERSRSRYPQRVVLTELAQLQRVSPTCRPGFRHLCSCTSRTPHQAMSDSADHP
jgi:hypothetical protein